MQITRILFLLFAANLAGCEVQSPLTQASAANLKGRSLATTARRRTAFLPRAPNPALGLGPLVGLMSNAGPVDEGEIILRKNGIRDPALEISRQLSEGLEHRYGLRHEARAIAFDEDDPTKLSVLAPSADLVIDLWTVDWSLRVVLDEPPKKDQPSIYQLHYAANFRLIDAKAVNTLDGKKGKVIAEGTCERSPEAPSSAATRDQFLAEGARRLKAELGQAVQYCVEEFRAKLLQPG